MSEFNLDNIQAFPFMLNGIKIYPVKNKDSEIFYNNIGCLMLEKNKSQDIQVIKMSYLKFIFINSLYAVQNKNEQYNFIGQLENILNIALREQPFDILYQTDELNDKFSVFIDVINEDNDIIRLNEKDFDIVRKVVLQQNLIPIPEFMDEEKEKALKSAKEFMTKKNKRKQATFEERVVSYKCETQKEYDYIMNLTIYQFTKELERMAIIKHFEVFSYPILKSGKAEDLQDWLCHIEERGIYDDVIMSEEEFNKLTSDKDIFKK